MLTNEAKQRACDLANAQNQSLTLTPREVDSAYPTMLALAQLCQDISDAVEGVEYYRDIGDRGDLEDAIDRLRKFRLPKPAPDPLLIATTKAMAKMRGAYHAAQLAELIGEHLAKTGHKIVEAGA